MGVAAKNVGKFISDPPTRILMDVSLEIKNGEFVALTGKSGAGKSTLLYILSSLDNPTEGSVEIDGRSITAMDSEALHRFRNLNMGFVFQFHYLIAELSAIENVLMPALKFHEEEKRRERAEMLLDRFGLKDKMNRRPRQLSGGEQQRLAIARSLIMQPKYLFADEPTGSLDTANAEIVMEILQNCSRQEGMTVVIVTHDPDFAARTDRQIRMADGRIV